MSSTGLDRDPLRQAGGGRYTARLHQSVTIDPVCSWTVDVAGWQLHVQILGPTAESAGVVSSCMVNLLFGGPATDGGCHGVA